MTLRELGELMLCSELVAMSDQGADRPPEFSVGRAMEVAALVLAPGNTPQDLDQSWGSEPCGIRIQALGQRPTRSASAPTG